MPRINIILPIVVAAILPGLSIVSNSATASPAQATILKAWLFGSVTLYILWHLLWFLWDIKSGNKKWWFALLPVAFIVAVSGILSFSNFLPSDSLQWHSVVRIVIASMLILTIQYALKAQKNISRLQLEKEQIQTENYKAQLIALQAKVDPHFLFNSLNTLRSMVHQKHDNSEKFILSLSDFYRQTLKHNENTTLELSEELTVLESYLFLMKSRNEQAISVNINIDNSLNGLHLPTLALQVVLENCFKHNTTSSKMPLRIAINSTGDNHIEVSNNRQPKIGDNESSGYGLKMLKKRYELMGVPNGVIIEKTQNQFSVKLKLIRR